MTQIFVGNVAYTTTETELRTLFERYGRVAAVRVPPRNHDGSARGFAFVTMPHFEDAEEAIVRLNGVSLGGRNLVINEAQRPTRTAQKPAAKGWDLL